MVGACVHVIAPVFVCRSQIQNYKSDPITAKHTQLHHMVFRHRIINNSIWFDFRRRRTEFHNHKIYKQRHFDCIHFNVLCFLAKWMRSARHFCGDTFYVNIATETQNKSMQCSNFEPRKRDELFWFEHFWTKAVGEYFSTKK